MTQPNPPSSHVPGQDFLQLLISTAKRKPGLWIVPICSAVLIGLLAGFLGPRNWDATQSFVVREELIGRIVRPGRFESLDTMKTTQEVIQEVSRRPAVLTRVLQVVDQKPPSREDIEALQGAISFHAPSGAELGKTEILNMRVEAKSADRALQLVETLFEETRKEIRSIRQIKANSMLAEIGESVELAQEKLAETSDKMREIEISVGSDLSELRSLNDPYSGGGDLRRRESLIQTEIREARIKRDSADQLIQHLTAASGNPDALLATPRELLTSQPSLSQLKNQLIEAQVKRSTTGGTYSEQHPRYVAVANSVRDIQFQIREELKSALMGLESQRQLAQQQMNALEKEAGQLETRIVNLAAQRIDYGQLMTELEIRNEELREAHSELTQAESILRASRTVDFLSQLDEAQAGLYPLGPSTKSMLAGALVIGCLIAFGLILIATPAPALLTPPAPTQTAPANLPMRQPVQAGNTEPEPNAGDLTESALAENELPEQVDLEAELPPADLEHKENEAPIELPPSLQTAQASSRQTVDSAIAELALSVEALNKPEAKAVETHETELAAAIDKPVPGESISEEEAISEEETCQVKVADLAKIADLIEFSRVTRPAPPTDSQVNEIPEIQIGREISSDDPLRHEESVSNESEPSPKPATPKPATKQSVEIGTVATVQSPSNLPGFVMPDFSSIDVTQQSTSQGNPGESPSGR